MLNSIRIRNFRMFRDLEVPKLSRVNLFVGKKKYGKSAHHEALELYASNASESVLFDLVNVRHENLDSEGSGSQVVLSSQTVRHLFCGHRFPIIGEDGFRIGESNESFQENALHVTSAGFALERQRDGSVERIHLTVMEPGTKSLQVEPALIAETSGHIRRFIRLDVPMGIPYRVSFSNRIHEGAAMPCQSVATGNMSGYTLAELWDRTSLTDLEPEVIRAMQLIEPRATAIAFVEDSGRNCHRIPLIKVNGFKDPLPLKYMGDGMMRIFHIILALVNASDGILLVDEFENGLHWSVQSNVWDMLFRLAERLNVQIFATTHSRDCIASFAKVWKENATSGEYYRLDSNEGHTKVTRYTPETLSDSLEMDVETR